MDEVKQLQEKKRRDKMLPFEKETRLIQCLGKDLAAGITRIDIQLYATMYDVEKQRAIQIVRSLFRMWDIQFKNDELGIFEVTK